MKKDFKKGAISYIDKLTSIEIYGDTNWLPGPNLCGGYVPLVRRIEGEGGKTILDLVPSKMLPEEVAPGDSKGLVIKFVAPSRPILYSLILNIVDGNFNWFSEAGSDAAQIGFEVIKSESDVP